MSAISVAQFGALVGDVARARMLVALFDHVELPASELARLGAVSPQTTSFHLKKLCQAGILSVAKRGRSRVYSLGGPAVASALEAIMATHPGAEPARPLKSIELARTCYDHLAGRLGVRVTDALTRHQWLVVAGETYEVTAEGEVAFAKLEIDVGALRANRRQFAKRCLDWTERRYHIAGSLGAALHDAMRRRKCVVPVRGTRILHVTPDGYRWLRRVIGVEQL
jgi:DNA-binding transcriptional ArsR family regulator